MGPKKKLATYLQLTTACLSEKKCSRGSICFLPWSVIVSSNIQVNSSCCMYFLAKIFSHRIMQPISYRVWYFGLTDGHLLGNIRVRKYCCKQLGCVVAGPKWIIQCWLGNRKTSNLLECLDLSRKTNENSHKYRIKWRRGSKNLWI